MAKNNWLFKLASLSWALRFCSFLRLRRYLRAVGGGQKWPSAYSSLLSCIGSLKFMPLAISAWAMVGLVPLLGIVTAAKAWTSSEITRSFFYLCCFCLCVFVGGSTLAVRMTGFHFEGGGHELFAHASRGL